MSVEITYRLHRLNGSRDMPELKRALSIYFNNTSARERTATNEIERWFIDYNASFKDELMLFVFYRNNELIGFSEIVAFKAQRIVAIDYLTISDRHMRNNVFYEFFEQIRSYIDSKGLEYDYIVTEVNYEITDNIPDTSNKLWISLLKMQGFHEIHAKYIIPKLGEDNYDSQATGELLVYSQSEMRSIRPKTYLKIVDTIYYDHYLRWYRPNYADDGAAYRSYLDGLRSDITSSIDESNIKVNGYSEVIKAKPINDDIAQRNDIIYLVLPIATAVILLSAIITILIIAYNAPINVVIISFSLVSVSLALAFSLVSERGRHVLIALAKTITSFGSK